MSAPAITSILIAGQGLAFELSAAALARNLPQSISITVLELEDLKNRDCLYGSLTAPTAHNFLFSLGLDEPILVLTTETVFSYGSQFKNWAGGHDWVQSFNNPFPVWENTSFHQFVTRGGGELEPYLSGAQAGLAGRFAHPPQDQNIPLSSAEYGYLFKAKEFCRLLKQQTYANVRRIKGRIDSITAGRGKVNSVLLKSGEQLSAEFFIDCTGPEAVFTNALKIKFQEDRILLARHISEPRDETEQRPLRLIDGNKNGWSAKTVFKNSKEILQVFHSEAQEKSDLFEFAVGHRELGWTGNCVSIGQSAYCLEPLTPAPMMLLQLDIERLLSLFPLTDNMLVEAKEYNRLYANDVLHCQMFHRSLFEVGTLPETPYWQSSRTAQIPHGLQRKLDQFLSRGFITNFDHEPFNSEDWIIQHFGLKRRPSRHDPVLDQISSEAIDQRLGQLSANINSMVQKMPPSDRYVENFRRYLEKKYGQ